MGEHSVGEATGILKPETRFVDWLAGMLNGMEKTDGDSAECDVQAWRDGEPMLITIEVRIKRRPQ